jgi:hypothetical protein
MRIDEFSKKEDFRLPFDLVDDVVIYMRNDPIFYRKQLFPAIMNMKDQVDAGKTPDPESCLGECASYAMESYCKKFKLGSPDNVFKDEDRPLIIDKLFGEEMTQIKNGAY